jgi:hypothetical protein
MALFLRERRDLSACAGDRVDDFVLKRAATDERAFAPPRKVSIP